MNSAEKGVVLHCLRAMIDEENCEECPIYGMTGTDHCEKDCVRLAINALEQEPCEVEAAKLQQAYNKGFEDCRQAVLDLAKFDGRENLGSIIHAFDVEQLPPVTPAEKVGQWIAQDIHNCHTDFRCSKCGYIHDFMHLYGKPTADYTYCPKCGSKMKEVEE